LCDSPDSEEGHADRLWGQVVAVAVPDDDRAHLVADHVRYESSHGTARDRQAL
jgi:hypothetical protein